MILTSDPRWEISSSGNRFEIIFTLEESDIGRYSVDLILTDELGEMDRLTLTMDVEEKPNPSRICHVIKDWTIVPVVNGICVLDDELSIKEGQTVSLDVVAMDQDVDTGKEDYMIFQMEHGPDFIALDMNTGRFTISPDQEDIGRHAINVTVQDLTGDYPDDHVQIEFDVVNMNDPPTEVRILSPFDGEEFNENDTLEFICTYDDNDLSVYGMDSHIIQWTSDTDGPLGTGVELSVSGLTPGDHLISVKVTDSFGLSDRDTISLTISEPDDDIDWAPVNENDNDGRGKVIPVELIILFSVASLLIWIVALAAFFFMRSRDQGEENLRQLDPRGLPIPYAPKGGNIENGVGTIPMEGGNRY
jgi:hypothetical protein